MSHSKKNKDVPAAPKAAGPDAPAAKKRPVHVIQVEDVSVPIFAYERQMHGSVHVNYSWSVQRSYKDSSGRWRRTPWFSPDDFGKVVTAIQRAEVWVHGQENKDVPV